MTYFEVLKILRKHRVVIISKILEKWESFTDRVGSEDNNDLKFSFLWKSYIEKYVGFEKLGIIVEEHNGVSECSIKYLSTVLNNFSDKIMHVRSPYYRIPVSLLDDYLKTIETLIIDHSTGWKFGMYAFFANGEVGLKKHSYFSYSHIYEDLEWNMDLVEKYKDIINWKLLVEKSNILWTEDLILRYMSYIPFYVEGETYCDKFNSNLVIQDFSRVDFLSDAFIEQYKECIDFHEFLSSAKIIWNSKQMTYYYNWAINIKIPHSCSFPKSMEGTKFKYCFFSQLVSNPNFVWNVDLLCTAIKLDSTMLDVFIGVNGEEKAKIRNMIKDIPNYQTVIDGMKDGDFYFMKLEDEKIMPFNSYSANFNLNNIKKNIINWNEVLTDKFVRHHRLSSDTYFSVYQVHTMWNYYEENPNVTLTYEICEYLEDKNICIGGEYEKEYDDQDYLDAGFYTKEINALSYFAHKPLKGKEELKKIFSNSIIFEKLLVGGNSDLIDDILDIMIKEYGINNLVTYILDDDKFEKEFGNK